MFDEAGEGDGVIDREVGENFAIESDAYGIEAFDEAVVVEAVGAASRANSLNPEAAEVAGAGFTVSIGPILSFVDGVFGVTEQLAPGSAKAFGFLENAFPPLTAGGAVSCTWHELIIRVNELLVGKKISRLIRSSDRAVKPDQAA